MEDGDDQLAAYAAANNITVDNGFAVDYTFAFNASGTTATDTLNVECGAGSARLGLGWTFCDAINLFGGQGTINSVETAAAQAVTLWPNPPAVTCVWLASRPVPPSRCAP